MSADRDALLGELASVGLSRNEGLAWLTLLEDDGEDGLTGYEVAARSGIPRSAVYTVLRKLERAGAGFSYGSDPARFVATDPTEWIAGKRSAAVQRMNALSTSLQQLPKRSRPEPIWTVQRYDDVMTRIDRMIRMSEQSLYFSLWPRELDRLMPAIEAVADRELHRVMHSPARIAAEPPGFSCWIDDVGDDEAKATWSHKALVVIDRRMALIGGTEPAADNHAVWTRNPSLVDVATNCIILDITLMAGRSGRDHIGDVAPMMRPHLLTRDD